MEGNQDNSDNRRTIQVVDPETYHEEVGEDLNHTHSDISPWVRHQIKKQTDIDSGSPQIIIDNNDVLLKKSLETVRLREGFETKGAKYGFSALLSNDAERLGNLDKLVDEFQLKPLPKRANHIDADTRIYDFAEAFIDPSTPIDKRLVLAKLHHDAIMDSREELSRVESSLRESFEQALQETLQNGSLPKEALVHIERAKSATIRVTDPVIDRARDRGGFYNPDENFIGISAEYIRNPEQLKEIFFHEMLHALSGATVRATTYTPHEDMPKKMEWDEDLKYESSRVGLDSLGNYEINEAYTEWATMTLLGKGYKQDDLYHDVFIGKNTQNDLERKYGQTYTAERVLLATLERIGVSIDSIGKAYFESYIPKNVDDSLERGERAPARWALDREINYWLQEPSLNKLLHSLRGNKPQAGKNNDNEKFEMVRNLAQKSVEAKRVRDKKALQSLNRMIGGGKKEKK